LRSGCRTETAGPCCGPPIAIGHELSLVLVAAAVLGLGLLTDPSVLRLAAASR
jgi:hypothetical protein